MNRTLLTALKALEHSSNLTAAEQATVREARTLLNQVENDLLAATAHLELEDHVQALSVLRVALGLPKEELPPVATPVVHEAMFGDRKSLRVAGKADVVVSLLPALEHRKQANEAQLYRQILDSVKHLDHLTD